MLNESLTFNKRNREKIHVNFVWRCKNRDNIHWNYPINPIESIASTQWNVKHKTCHLIFCFFFFVCVNAMRLKMANIVCCCSVEFCLFRIKLSICFPLCFFVCISLFFKVSFSSILFYLFWKTRMLFKVSIGNKRRWKWQQQKQRHQLHMTTKTQEDEKKTTL